jgi:hypothetical protein
MCICKRPHVNGENGLYGWMNGSTVQHSTYPPNPPALIEGDEILCDEPGRCGVIDSHAFHFRIVRHHGAEYFLVRHGAGDERIFFNSARYGALDLLLAMDSNARYWMLAAIYYTMQRQTRKAVEDTEREWKRAAIEKRIKVRRRRGIAKVEIVPPAIAR